MNCANQIAVETAPVPDVQDVRLPMGLLGFEQIKDYQLITRSVEEPFCWLQVKGDPSLAFVVLNPFLAAPDYRPDIPQQDVAFLGLTNPEDAVVFNIVTLHGPNRATVNLKGPVVLNRHTNLGKQVVIANASQYSVEHPLPLGDAAAE